MDKSYEKLLQSLNDVKCELKKRNDPSFERYINYIKDIIIEAGRLNARYANLSAAYDTYKFLHRSHKTDDWSKD